MFAEIATTPSQVGIWIGCLALVVSIVTNIILCFAAVRPQKREVTINENTITKREFDQHADEDREELGKIEGQIRDLRAERKSDVGKLHDRIDVLVGDIGGLQTATDLQNQQLAQISSRLDRLIERRGA